MDGLGGLNSDCEVAVIGGGIVGLATALALVEREGREVLLLEAELAWRRIRPATTAA